MLLGRGVMQNPCGLSQDAPVDVARRPAAQRRMRAQFAVEAEPRTDGALGVAPAGQPVQLHRLVLQRTPREFVDTLAEYLWATVEA